MLCNDPVWNPPPFCSDYKIGWVGHIMNTTWNRIELIMHISHSSIKNYNQSWPLDWFSYFDNTSRNDCGYKQRLFIDPSWKRWVMAIKLIESSKLLMIVRTSKKALNDLWLKKMQISFDRSLKNYPQCMRLFLIYSKPRL